MLISLLDLIRDLAILAAAIGIAKCAWDWQADGPRRRDDAAKAAMAAERLQADLKQWSTAMAAHAAEASVQLGEIAGSRHRTEALAQLKGRLHGLLQSTPDPYLSFAEIATALGGGSQEAGAIDSGALRLAILELVASGVIAQLDQDRYFIASDYEAGGDHATAEE